MPPLPDSIDATLDLLRRGDYIPERSTAAALYLSLSLARPLFLEGEAGVGKTELARTLAKTLGRKLVHLQCYEGLDIAHAVYEWNYAAQMIHIRLAETQDASSASLDDVFSERFLIRRPLLQALQETDSGAPVLLIDELDRSDAAFEAFLLELLADYRVTIPEIGTLTAKTPPIVVITSNRTREIHDALKRRCFYHWLDYPDMARQLEILQCKAPDAPATLTRQIVAFIQELRALEMFRQPGIAEAIDWANALARLDATQLEPALVEESLGALLKYQDDIELLRSETIESLLQRANTH